MLQQHPDLKNEPSWMPKEIIVFGRRFGYTPVNTFTSMTNTQLQNNPLKDLIKQHIKEERLKNITITFNNKINDFIKQYDDLTLTYSITSSSSPLEIIDVDGETETPTIELKAKPTQVTSDKLVFDVNKIMQSGGMLVNDICNDIHIKLQPEEIVEGKLVELSF